MKELLLTLATGVVFGVIDILPMVKMKLDKHAIVSAFSFYLFVPFIVYSTNLFGMPWWLRGSIITFILAVPTLVLIAKDDIKSTIPVSSMSVVLGALIGLVGHFLWGFM